MKQPKTYVLYGYNKADKDQVGYFGKDLSIVLNRDLAKTFCIGRKKAGSPEQWRDFINGDNDLNHGFKFHLVSVIA